MLPGLRLLNDWLAHEAMAAQETVQGVVARLGDHAAAIKRSCGATARHGRRIDNGMDVAGMGDHNRRHAVMPDPALDDLKGRFVLVDVDLAIANIIGLQEALCTHQVRAGIGSAENDKFLVHSSSTMPRLRYRRSCQVYFTEILTLLVAEYC